MFAWGTIRVRGRGSGADVDFPSGGVFEIRGGRVTRWEDLGSREAALAALEPTDVVRLVHDAFNRRELDEFLAYWHEDCTYRAAIEQVVEGEAGAFHGHEGLRRWWTNLHELYEGLASRVLATAPLGERVLVEFEISGRGARSGLDQVVTLAQIAVVRDGRIVDARDYASRDEALSSVG